MFLITLTNVTMASISTSDTSNSTVTNPTIQRIERMLAELIQMGAIQCLIEAGQRDLERERQRAMGFQVEEIEIDSDSDWTYQTSWCPDQCNDDRQNDFDHLENDSDSDDEDNGNNN